MADGLILLAAGLTALAVLLLVLGGSALVRRRTARARLERFTADLPETGAVETAPSSPFSRGWRAAARQVGSAIPLRGGRTLQAVRARYVSAGQPGGLDADQLLGVRLLVAAGGATAVVLFLAGGGSLGTAAALLAAATALVGPELWLRQRVRARRRQIEQDLLTFVDLLSLCLTAGMGFDNAVATVAERMGGPLAEEMQRYLAGVLELGLSRRDALTSLAERVGSPDLAAFAEAVVQASEMGAGLLSVLGSQARLLRQERRRRAEASARTAPVRMLLPMTAFILPVLMLIVVGPVVLRLLGVRPGGG